MTDCNQGVVLGKVARWCHLPANHPGDHETTWLLKPFTFPEPPPRYGTDGTRADLTDEPTKPVSATTPRRNGAQKGTQR